MITKNQLRYFLIFVIAGAVIAGLIGSGCENDNIVDTSSDTKSISADAAYSIAVATGEEGGGVLESYSDLLNLQSMGKISTTLTITDGDFEKVLSEKGMYESSTGWWTVSINRTHAGRITSSELRTYKCRFWKNSTQSQKFCVVNGDTAAIMEFKIVSGSGYFKNPTIVHRVTQLSGTFLVTNITKDIVTITLEGDYISSAVDSIVTEEVTRVLTYTITIHKDNTQIQTLRFQPTILKPIARWRNDFYRTTNGIIRGNISATATMSKDDFYKERSIDKDFTVSFINGSGVGSIGLGSNGTYGRYRFNLKPDDGNE